MSKQDVYMGDVYAAIASMGCLVVGIFALGLPLGLIAAVLGRKATKSEDTIIKVLGWIGIIVGYGYVALAIYAAGVK